MARAPELRRLPRPAPPPRAKERPGTAGHAPRVEQSRKVPRISEFLGIVISMYYNDHAPPHFHARYAEHEAQVEIASLKLIAGSLPARVLGLVREWALIYRSELWAEWDAARRGVPLSRIPGLE